MPKRKLTPARRAAIVKWQLAGARARAEKAGKRVKPAVIQRQLNRDKATDRPWAKTRTLLDPMGKHVTLYHRTTMKEAKKLATEGFKVRKGSDVKDVYFSNRLFGGAAKGFGPAAVSVRIRSNLIKDRDTAHWGFKYARQDENWKWKVQRSGESWIQLDSKHLKGVKVKRVSTVPKSKRGRKKK